jgi:hypothetical protein
MGELLLSLEICASSHSLVLVWFFGVFFFLRINGNGKLKRIYLLQVSQERGAVACSNR